MSNVTITSLLKDVATRNVRFGDIILLQSDSGSGFVSAHERSTPQVSENDVHTNVYLNQLPLQKVHAQRICASNQGFHVDLLVSRLNV